MSRVILTKEGFERLQAELDRLKNEERPKITEAIVEARSHGDLKENAEYHAAREQQSFIEGRIKELESKLSVAEVIDVKTIAADGKIVFGSTVEALDLDTDKKVLYKIVGNEEADVDRGLISFASPIGRAFLGHYTGDILEVQVPEGTKSFEILSVRYV